MFDMTLRPLKDRVFDPFCSIIPAAITPLQLTIAAFAFGTASCIAATVGSPSWAVTLWILNRIFDCLDGAIARQRNQTSDTGGFLDLLGDFIIYSVIPISCATGIPSDAPNLQRLWSSVAVAEATFHVNNFVLFYTAAVAEKRRAANGDDGVKQLTSVMMRPALVEGAESGAIFTVMLMKPEWTEALCWTLSTGVAVGTMQRVTWVVQALSSAESGKVE